MDFVGGDRVSPNCYYVEDTHTNKESAKGSRTLLFLQRNLYHCAEDVKERSFKTSVWPQLETHTTSQI